MLVANIIAFIASIIMVLTGLLNNKKQILFVQGIEIILFMTSDIIIGGYSGAVINLLSLVRNIIVYKDRLNITSKVLLLISSTALTLYFNNLGLIGLLPLASMYIYVLFMNTKDIKKFKILMIVTMFMWATYDMTIKLYTSLTFDILTIISTLTTLIILYRGDKNGIRKNKNSIRRKTL